MNKKIIDWQNVENYYKSLSKNLDNALYLIVGNDYRHGFNILKLIFLSIELEVRELDPDTASDMKGLTEKIKEDIREYEMLILQAENTGNVNRKQQINLAKIKARMEDDIDKYWEMLHNTMNRLNMLFPKKPKDDLPIYQP